MNYAEYLTTLATLTAIDVTNPEFLIMVPNASEYANNRIGKELAVLLRSNAE
jgi:hypothetical protein